jgi:hypothetical protein
LATFSSEIPRLVRNYHVASVSFSMRTSLEQDGSLSS